MAVDFALPSDVTGSDQVSVTRAREAIIADVKLIAIFPLESLPDQLKSSDTFKFREQVLIFAFMKIVRPLASKLLARDDEGEDMDGDLPQPVEILHQINDTRLLEIISDNQALVKHFIVKFQSPTVASDKGGLETTLNAEYAGQEMSLTEAAVRETLRDMNSRGENEACAVFTSMDVLVEDVEGINISKTSMSALVLRLRSGLVVVVGAKFFGFFVLPEPSAVPRVRGSIEFSRAEDAHEWLRTASSPPKGRFKAAIFLDDANDQEEAGLAFRQFVAGVLDEPMFSSQDVALCLESTPGTRRLLASVRSDAELHNYPYAKTLTPPILSTAFIEFFEEDLAKQVGEQLITLPIDPVARQKLTGLSYIPASERKAKYPRVLLRVEVDDVSNNWKSLDTEADKWNLPGVEYILCVRLSPGLNKFEYKLHSMNRRGAALLNGKLTTTGTKKCVKSISIKFSAARLGLEDFEKAELTLNLGVTKRKLVRCFDQLQ